jgi:Phosphotransferase enzyme family
VPPGSKDIRAVTDAAVVGRILREYRLGGIDPADVRRLYGSVSGTRVGYLVAPPGPATMVVRAFRSDVPLAPQFQGCGTASVTDWLQQRAATLEWLARRGYRAPRMVPTRTGEPVGVAGIWLTGATTHVTGPPLTPGGGGLDLLGAVQTLLPADWRPMHEEFRRTLLALRQAARTLPLTAIHGDAWPGNVIRTGEGQVTLIDWENSGLGLAVTDLGYCLLESHRDPGLPAAGHIRPDQARIGALLSGYSRLRRLNDAERQFLLPGIRFAAAVAGARHFEQALVDGVRGPVMDARLSCLRNRLEVSRAVAELALRHLGEPPTRYAEPGSSVAGGTGA